jgi:polysaccharide pyruvyl transferase WcaK-like protein
VLVCPYIQGNQGAHVIFSAYRQCAVILGMRFHANVCGFGMGIPTIGLGSYPKLFDLYQELHFDDRCVNIRRPEAIPEIHTLILDSIKHRMLIKNDYQQRKFQMLEQLRALYQRIIINNF